MPTALLDRPAPAAPASVRRCGLYLRMSLINKDDGIERQRDEGSTMADRRGWQIVDTYAEKVSAKGKANRVQFRRMIADVRAGKLDVIVAWDLTRLTRNARDRLALVEACRDLGVIVALVKGSDMDPTTASGRLVIGILGEVAQMEIDLKSERQLSADHQRAQRGFGPSVTRYRAFGYTPELVVIDAEAEAIRDAAAAILAGASTSGIARQWDAAGFRPTGGADHWSVSTVRAALTHPRVSALVTRGGEIVLGPNGDPVPAVWAPILDDDTRRAVAATLAEDRVLTVATRGGGTTTMRPRTNRGGGRPESSLLGGIALCPCGSKVTTGQDTATGRGTYRCRDRIADYQGKHLGSRSRKVADAFVRTVMITRLGGDDLEALLRRQAPDVAPLRAERQTLTARLAEVADMLADGELNREQARRANERVNGRLTEVDEVLADAARESVLALLVGAEDVAGAWDGMPVDRRRTVIRELASVTLGPVDPSQPRAVREDPLSWVSIEPQHTFV